MAANCFFSWEGSWNFVFPFLFWYYGKYRIHEIQKSRNHWIVVLLFRSVFTEPSVQCDHSYRRPGLSSEKTSQGGLYSLARGLGSTFLMEKEMATHTSILAWEIPQTEEAGWATFSPWDHKSDATSRLHHLQDILERTAQQLTASVQPVRKRTRWKACLHTEACPS